MPPSAPEDSPVPSADRPPLVDRDLFIAVTSHELRTPVTVIKGFADTLVEHWDALDQAGRQAAVQVIQQRADELAQLVDRLLTTTAEPPGAVTPAPFDLAAALHEIATGLGGPLRERLRVTVPADLPRAFGDRASLATVITELVTNAAKFSAGEVELAAAADLAQVRLRVADRGIGIAPAHVEQAFVRYWQADSGDRRARAGAGLGLYLVRQIVARQQGTVTLHPRDGGGTVAEVRLPRADHPAEIAPQSSQEARTCPQPR